MVSCFVAANKLLVHIIDKVLLLARAQFLKQFIINRRSPGRGHVKPIIVLSFCSDVYPGGTHGATKSSSKAFK